MPGGRCSPCHPTTAVRSLPVPPGLPFCPASKECPQSASSPPSLHSEPAAAIRQIPLFPNSPRARPRSERQRTSEGSGPGGAAGASPQAEPPPGLRAPSAPFFPHFRMGLRMRRRGPLGKRPGRSPKVPGAAAPGSARAGRPGSRGTDGDWEQSPGVTHDAAGSLARLTRDIYYIIILFFLVRQYCAFWFGFVLLFFFIFFPFGGKK